VNYKKTEDERERPRMSAVRSRETGETRPSDGAEFNDAIYIYKQRHGRWTGREYDIFVASFINCPRNDRLSPALNNPLTVVLVIGVNRTRARDFYIGHSANVANDCYSPGPLWTFALGIWEPRRGRFRGEIQFTGRNYRNTLKGLP